MKYQPRPEDIEWAKAIMTKTKDGGLMRMPSADLIYRKKQNKFILVYGDRLCECHKRTVEVFEAAGFKVKVKHEPYGKVIQELREALSSCDQILVDRAGVDDISRLFGQNN